MADPTQKVFRFLQFSDSLFDSGRALKSLELSPSQRRERNEEGLIALEDMLAAGHQKGLDCVIVAGNLFDAEFVTSATIERLQKVFGRMKIPVIIAPGQFDTWSENSMYSQKALDAKGLERWPANVFIFSKTEYQVIRVPERRDVTVTARALPAEISPLDFTTIPNARDDDASIRILVSQMTALTEPKSPTLSLEKSSASPGFTYTAFSGYPNHLVVRDEADQIFGSFAGTLFGQTVLEQGQRYGLYCTVDPSKSNAVEVTPVEADRRKIHVCVITFAKTSPDVYLQRIEDSIRSANARSRDILILKFFGEHLSGAPVAIRPEDLSQRYYHVKMDDRTRPDYADPAPDSTESRYIALVEELKTRFRSNANLQEEKLSDELIEDALYFGLSALREGKVVMRDAD